MQSQPRSRGEPGERYYVGDYIYPESEALDYSLFVQRRVF